MSKWKTVRLGDVFELQMGKTPDRKRLDYFKGSHKWISIADISKSDEEGWDLQWWDLDEYTKEIVGNVEDARYDALLDERRKLLNLLDRLEN